MQSNDDRTVETPSASEPELTASSPAIRADAFTSQPPPPVIASPPPPPPEPLVSPPAETPTQPAPAAAVVNRTLWGWVMPSAAFVSLIVFVLYVTPMLLMHWRIREAQGEAEAIYQKRRAELRAEAEHADARLDALDKRVHLASLGFREVVRKVAPMVVNVANYREPKQEIILGPIGKRSLFYDADKDRHYVQLGVGSGLLVKPGHVLTNHHVIVNAQRLRLTFASGRSLGLEPSAAVSDAITDLAVIRLPADLPAALKDEVNTVAEFADSDKDVHVGDWTLAIGSPLNLRQTVTQGVISAKGRLLHMLDLVELLQTDAAINPGNSGGPLFDQLGRVAGINVAIASDNGGNQGIGFAIPSNTTKKIVEQLIENGEVPRGYLGIALEELPGPKAKALGVVDGGVVITKIVPGDPAQRAGLQQGDVIVRMNNEVLSQYQPVRHFRQLIVDIPPQRDVNVEILRNGQRQTVTVKVGKRPANLP
ncbi:MAG: trypsin-like peptidase domain-containing protein [Gemmataceae bacterium]|nr:trypsin-like peptidase domain-containing protein [Gemmataceae bacterium]